MTPPKRKKKTNKKDAETCYGLTYLTTTAKNECRKKVFNRNNLKVSFSCLRNKQKLISHHNRNLFNNSKNNKTNSINDKKEENMENTTAETIINVP